MSSPVGTTTQQGTAAVTRADLVRLAADLTALFASSDYLPAVAPAAVQEALPTFLRELGVRIARDVTDCAGCGHFSPHAADGGCGAEVRDEDRTKRCGCLARNDDDAHDDTFARHTCNPKKPGRPRPYGALAPVGECRRCDERRAGAPARDMPASLRAVKARQRDEEQTRAAIDEHFAPGGPHVRGDCGPVCTRFDY